MAFGKKNVVNLDPFSYNLGLIGEGGCGKTTIIKEMCEKYLPEGGYLFAECGREDGADAISGIQYVNCPDWNSDYDEVNNSVGFKILIEDIIENKDSEYPNLRVLVIDTYDQLYKIAEKEVVRLHNKDHEKKVKSIKASWGGYFAGEDMADDLCLDYLWRLKEVNVHFYVIGHTKLKEQIDETTGDTYVRLTTDMMMRSFNKLKTKLHFLGVAHHDREIMYKKEKDDKKATGRIKNETRIITFRDDNFAVDSKSRFADVINDCEFTPDALYKAMTDAIETEAKKGEGGLKAAQKHQKEYDEKKSAQASENSKTAKEHKIDEDKNNDLISIIKENYSSLKGEAKENFTALMKAKGITSFKNADEIPTADLQVLADFFN